MTVGEHFEHCLKNQAAGCQNSQQTSGLCKVHASCGHSMQSVPWYSDRPSTASDGLSVESKRQMFGSYTYAATAHKACMMTGNEAQVTC